MSRILSPGTSVISDLKSGTVSTEINVCVCVCVCVCVRVCMYVRTCAAVPATIFNVISDRLRMLSLAKPNITDLQFRHFPITKWTTSDN